MIKLLVPITSSHRAWRFILHAVPSLVIGLLLFGGCSFSYEGPKLGRYGDGLPPKAPVLLTIGELKFTDPSITETNEARFKAAFGKGLDQASDAKLVQFVFQPTNSPPETSSLVLSGTIGAMKKSGGSGGLLLTVGAERWHLPGSFQVRNASGKLLTEFTGEYKLSSEGWGAGVGISGPNMATWEHMANGFGFYLGDEICAWMRQKRPVSAAGAAVK